MQLGKSTMEDVSKELRILYELENVLFHESRRQMAQISQISQGIANDFKQWEDRRKAAFDHCI